MRSHYLYAIFNTTVIIVVSGEKKCYVMEHECVIC